MIGQKMFLLKMWSLWQETLFSTFVPDPNSQPSSHNYYHHLDLTLSTLCLFYPTECTTCTTAFISFYFKNEFGV